MNQRAFLTAIGLMGVAITLTVAISSRDLPMVIATNIERLPMTIDDFSGSDDRYPNAIYAVLNADQNLYRHYRSAAGSRLDLYIGYYGTAKGGRSAHSPAACLPGAGWGILHEQTIDLATDGEVAKPVRSLVAVRDGRYVTLFHWYQMDKTDVAGSGIRQNLLRFKNRLLHNRDDGAFVQISVFCEERGQEEAKRIGLAFARKIGRLLPDYWPQER